MLWLNGERTITNQPNLDPHMELVSWVHSAYFVSVHEPHENMCEIRIAVATLLAVDSNYKAWVQH
jgi:hypothetical protein